MNQWELFRFESPHDCFLRATLTTVLSHPQTCSQSNQLLPRMLSTKHSSMSKTAKCFPPTKIKNSWPHPVWGPWTSATLVGVTLEIPILCMILHGFLILNGCSTQRPSFGVCLISDKAWVILSLIVSSVLHRTVLPLRHTPIFSCCRIQTELINRQCWVQKTELWSSKMPSFWGSSDFLPTNGSRKGTGCRLVVVPTAMSSFFSVSESSPTL